MALWKELKERRITQVVIGYLAGGWIVLAGVDQLVDRGVLPELTYRLVLILYIGGIFGAVILGWYHGEKGSQKVTFPEVVLLTFVTIITLGFGGLVARNHQQAERMTVQADLASGLDPRRIAVLYFEDDSRGGSLAHVADGLTESLITALSDVGSLEVISRNGTLPFKGSDTPREEIARHLDAGTLVSGSVESAGRSIRVSLAIADGGSGAVFRRGTLEYPQDDLLELTTSVAEEVSSLLREWLGEEVEVRRRSHETSDAGAWALMQRGERARKEAESRLEAQDLAGFVAALMEADTLLAEAQARDPSWARPPTVRGQVQLRLAQLAHGDPIEASGYIDVGLDHVRTALQRDQRFASALETRGLFRYLRWRYNLEPQAGAAARLIQDAEEDLQAAVRIDSSLATAWNVLSIIYAEKSDPVNAKIAARRAYDEDAYMRAADHLLWSLYATSYDLEQFTDAIYFCEEGARRFPDHHRFVECELWLLASRARPPDVERAWELHRRYTEVSGVEPGSFGDRRARIVVAGVLARADMTDSANATLRAARSTPDVDPSGELLGLEAVFRLQMGETEQAMDLVRQYLTASPSHRGGWRWSSHWWWRGLQDHPDFRALVGDPGGAATGNQ
jgi:TolB-like protein/tetratricopeptide (TPR) repeat protein